MQDFLFFYCLVWPQLGDRSSRKRASTNEAILSSLLEVIGRINDQLNRELCYFLPRIPPSMAAPVQHMKKAISPPSLLLLLLFCCHLLFSCHFFCLGLYAIRIAEGKRECNISGGMSDRSSSAVHGKNRSWLANLKHENSLSLKSPYIWRRFF